MAVWTYRQRDGALIDPTGNLVECGYSGMEPVCNLPAAERIPDWGPIPSGAYAIGPERDDEQMGPCCLPLEPSPENEMYGRHSFYVHGDNETSTASTGCIIMSRPTRDMIAASSVRELLVTA